MGPAFLTVRSSCNGGELVFEEPWQGRTLGMAAVALDRLGVPWPDFRRHLADAVAARPASQDESAATAYYAAWLDALETLLSLCGSTPTTLPA